MTKRASTARKGDAIDVVEAAYNLDPALNETQWVTGVVQALYPRFDYGLGICAFISDAERPFEAVAGFDLPEGWDRAMNALMSSSAGPKLNERPASGTNRESRHRQARLCFERSDAARMASAWRDGRSGDQHQRWDRAHHDDRGADAISRNFGCAARCSLQSDRGSHCRGVEASAITRDPVSARGGPFSLGESRSCRRGGA